MSSLPFRFAILLALGKGALGGALPAQTEPEARDDSRARPWPVVGTVVGVNTLVWGVNRFVKDEDWARVGVNSWSRNFRQGFVWDDDHFQANQFAHPYHGSIYFGAARANGYGYWGAVPFTAAGSLMWEYLGETKRPSLNDFINTTVGGMALGEITHRFSARLRGPGRSRAGFGRTMAAAAISPGGGLRRMDAGADVADEPFRQHLVNGYSWGGDTRGTTMHHPFVALSVEGGTAFGKTRLRPYDAFDFHLELTGGESTVITRAQVHGVLARHLLRHRRSSRLALTLVQEYDYTNNSAHEWGGQGVSGGVLYGRSLGRETELRLGAHLKGIVLGAVSSEYADRVGRSYDYGPGLGTRAVATLRRGDRDLLALERTGVRLRSLNGADADHLVTVVRARLQIPATRFFDVGTDANRLVRHSRYARVPHVTQQVSQVRAYIVLLRS